MSFVDRTGQVWMIGFGPHQHLAIVVRTVKVSDSLSEHDVVRLGVESPRSFHLDESIHHPLEKRVDMWRIA